MEKSENEKLWAFVKELQREITRLKAIIDKLTKDKKEKGEGPEIYCSPGKEATPYINPDVPYTITPHIAPWKAEDTTFKNTKPKTQNPCIHVYSAQTEICVHCREHISKHER